MDKKIQDEFYDHFDFRQQVRETRNQDQNINEGCAEQNVFSVFAPFVHPPLFDSRESFHNPIKP